MNVQNLIDLLMEVQDKTLPVCVINVNDSSADLHSVDALEVSEGAGVALQFNEVYATARAATEEVLKNRQFLMPATNGSWQALTGWLQDNGPDVTGDVLIQSGTGDDVEFWTVREFRLQEQAQFLGEPERTHMVVVTDAVVDEQYHRDKYALGLLREGDWAELRELQFPIPEPNVSDTAQTRHAYSKGYQQGAADTKERLAKAVDKL